MNVLNVLTIGLVILAALSFLLVLWQWLAGWRFPLHQRTARRDFTPPVTLLKPLKSCDAETERCLRSWFEQDYAGDMQLLFGVANEADPVCDLAQRLIAEYSAADARLIVCGATLGANAKVSTLIQLERQARHDVLVISDADVCAPGDLLVNVISPLCDPDAGLVNCFYQFANPSNLAMQCEAIAVNADFWSQVLQSQDLKPLDFALGAVMATRRAEVRAIGGFESLAAFLADDYQLGNQIARTGKHIVLSPVVAGCWESPKGWRQVWAHQLRWARTIRACQPVPFFFSILGNATLWPLLLSGFLWLAGVPFSFLALLIVWPARIYSALNLQERLTQKLDHYRYFWLVPIKDLLGAAVWAAAFLGNEITWRGNRYRIVSGGKLQKIDGVQIQGEAI